MAIAATPSERLERAEAEARALREEVAGSRDAMLGAEGRAADAAARRQEVATLLAEGRERRATLELAVAEAGERLDHETARLARAEAALAQRLVAIYKAGPTDSFSVAVSADGYDDLVTRTAYMRQIHDADTRLAARVEEVRDRVRGAGILLRDRRREAVQLESALEAAHAERVLVADAAAERAGDLRAATAERDAALTELSTRIDGWERVIAAAQSRQDRPGDSAGEQGSADEPGSETVDEWFGGPYAIPTSIVMCESGGNYRALNPTSGAGGAYQIIPSTWEYYGGTGLPHEASKAEQDRIAALIWANDGPGAWVCKE